MLPAESWESQSFDSKEPTTGRSSRSSSRTSLQDRQKCFDATTPTLFDEEEPDEEVLLLFDRGMNVWSNKKCFDEENNNETTTKTTTKQLVDEIDRKMI